MISVPEAGLVAQPAPVNAGLTTRPAGPQGSRWGTAERVYSKSTQPIPNEPVVVSLPALTAVSRPYAPRASRAAGGTPQYWSRIAQAQRAQVRQVQPADGTGPSCPGVLLPRIV